jgi:hypothetical protein
LVVVKQMLLVQGGRVGVTVFTRIVIVVVTVAVTVAVVEHFQGLASAVEAARRNSWMEVNIYATCLTLATVSKSSDGIWATLYMPPS